MTCVLFVIFSLFAVIGQASSQNGYEFAYLISHTSATQMILVNPEDSLSERDVTHFPTPNEWRVNYPPIPNAAQDGNQWMVFTVAEPSTYTDKIVIFNKTNGFTTEIQTSIAGAAMRFRWSPDGLKLAIITAINDADLDVYVYSIESNILVNVTDDGLDQRDVSWFPDSQSLSIMTFSCENNEACGGILSTYRIDDVTKTGEISIMEIFGSGLACNMSANTMGTFVAFTSYCMSQDSTAGPQINDAYLWDIANNSVSAITSFAQQAATRNAPIYSIFDYTWLDDDTLLIGADYRVFGVEEGHQLQTYAVTTGTTTVLSTAIGAGFSVNPVTQEVLLRPSSSEFTPAQPPAIDATIPLSLMNTTALETASTMSLQAVDTVSAPLTTDWVWSPDGVYAYGLVLSTVNDADYGSYTVAFLDGRTREVTQEVISVTGDPASSYIIPIGWVRR
jgi:hypothetical protein